MLRPLATYGPTALIGGATATILAFGSPFPAADLAATLAMAALVCAAQIAMTRHLIAWYEQRLADNSRRILEEMLVTLQESDESSRSVRASVQD